MAKTFLLTLSIISLPFLLCGCGGGPSDQPELGEVSGVVKVDGNPEPNIKVTFMPEKGRPSIGITNENGEYVLKYSEEEIGTKVGTNYVTITRMLPEAASDDCGGCGCGGAPSGADLPDPIHAKYNRDARDNPEMKVEVKAGSQEFNFDVETDPSATRDTGECNGGGSDPCLCG